jgi:predicted DNA-binding protein (UPF0251 family)
MPRPCKCRQVSFQPGVSYFKPRAIPLDQLEEVVLTLDEFESVRLADMEGMYQEDAAEQMHISRQTFGNIVSSAHTKIADALVNAKAIRIEGGVYQMAGIKTFRCYECGHVWGIPYGTPKPAECPRCRNNNIHRAEQDRGPGRCGLRRGRCRRSRV